MRNARLLTIVTVALVISLFQGSPIHAEDMGTAFTYQGSLIDSNDVADGLYDFQFKLFDSAENGNQLNGDVNVPGLDVNDGYFTVELDFGSDVFNGDARWLDIGVRPDGETGAYTKLNPRQELTPTPYALHTYGLTVVGDNTFIGKNAGISNTNGYHNTFSGFEAGRYNTEGHDNTFSGYRTGYYNKEGNYNTFSGNYAGLYNTTGSYNTFSGYRAGRSNTIGYSNTFSGFEAGYSNTEGNYNTFSGYRAGYSNTKGYDNTFLGYDAGYYNTTGYYNTFLGNYAGFNNNEGNHNTFSGYYAGYSNTTGSSNTFSGYRAGYYNTGGSYNTFSGYQAGRYNRGNSNTFSGYQTGYSNTTGYENTFSGHQAGYNNTEGYYNTFSGAWAGYSNTEGSYNVFIGHEAGYHETGSNKLYIDSHGSQVPLIYGDFSTKRIGLGTIYPNHMLEVEGRYEEVSLVSLRSINSSGNSYGLEATADSYGGSSGSATGAYLYAKGGYESGDAYGVKSYAVAYGSSAAYGIYSNATYGVTTGKEWAFYGVGHGYFSGYVGLGTTTPGYRLQLPNFPSSSGQAQANDWKTYSSRRWKTNIQPIEDALEKVQQLRGVSFDWKSNSKHDIGLIAEEVGQVLPEIVDYEENGIDATGMSYGKLTPLLVEAVKELKTEVDELRKENTELRSRLEAVEKSEFNI